MGSKSSHWRFTDSFPSQSIICVRSVRESNRARALIPLHRELADLRVQLVDLLAIRSALVGGSAAKHLGGPLQQLVLPAGDLGSIYLILGSKLGGCLLAFQCFQGHSGLERRGMVSSGSSHRIRSFQFGIYSSPIHLSPCPKLSSHLTL